MLLARKSTVDAVRRGVANSLGVDTAAPLFISEVDQLDADLRASGSLVTIDGVDWVEITPYAEHIFHPSDVTEVDPE